MLKDTKKFFYIFLLLNALFWVLVESFRNLLSFDSMEAVIWGNLLSVGTNKHPPLSGWLAGGIYAIFQEHDIAIYILGQICIIVALIFIYKLSKNFFDDKKAICSSLIMAPCVYYTYQLFYDNYNCNYISIPLWIALAYFFLKSIKTNKLFDWSILGIIAGLSFLAKYQVAFLFLALFFYLLICERRCFKQFGMYLSVGIAAIIVAPHIYWLFQNNFFPFVYLIGKATSSSDVAVGLIQRFIFPIKFFLDQILALAPCFGLYLILAYKEKNISVVKFSLKDKNLIFILLVGLLPMLTIGTMGLFTASRVVGAWASTMVGFFGIVLFYVFPVNFSEKTFDFFKKWLIGLMCAWLFGMFIFVQLQKKTDMSFPHQEIMPKMNEIWYKKTNAPLKYVAGVINLSAPFRIYNEQKPVVLLNTYGNKNPWTDEDDVKKSGFLIIEKNSKSIYTTIEDLGEIVPSKFNFEIQKFDYDIKNALGSIKHHAFYYVIVPPVKNNN